MELWKDIRGYEGYYQVSSIGRIKSLPRIFVDKNGKEKRRSERLHSCINRNGGYLTATLCVNKKRKSFRVHQLVADAFIGERPSLDHQIHHLDGNAQNNCVENLQYILPKDHSKVTSKQNPSLVAGLRYYNQVVKTKRILQCDLDGTLITEFLNGSDASNVTGVCQRNILQVANQTEYKPGKVRNQAGGYKWKFKKDEIKSN